MHRVDAFEPGDMKDAKMRPMKARITLITLGVDDLEHSLRFYRDGMGLRTEGIVGTEFEHGAVVFFDLQPGLKLALWPRRSIAYDTGLLVTRPSRREVDVVMAQAKAAGATITQPAHDTFWGGYAGYFQDPDQHLWEVAWNPHVDVE